MSTDGAGSSTPSRKRSKWDEDSDELELSIQAPPSKRRTKVKMAKPVVDSHPPAGARITHRPTHSIYVPSRTRHPPILPSRSVYCYERLNQIEEGSYGVVYRARDRQNGDIVALKKLKLEEEKNGFPITALREVYALMSCRHENVVGVREVVVGDTLTQCVPAHFSLAVLYQPFCEICLKSFCRDGLHRTRPQIASHRDAFAILAI
jgi:cell division cycle 2-like protein